VARQSGIEDNDLERVVFVFAKDRLENWIEFLVTGSTDEAQEGPREKDGKTVAAAKKAGPDVQGATTRSSAPAIPRLVMPKRHRLVARMRD
jgi:hypothetical protein